MSNGWIKSELEFMQRIVCVNVSGRYLKSLGLKYLDFLNPQSVEESVRATKIKDFLPSDAALVRVSVPSHQDAICFYFVSQLFPEIKEYELMESITLEDLANGKLCLPTKN